MDPNEILHSIDQAILNCDIDTATIYLGYYASWRHNGGWQPFEVAGTLKRGDEFARWCQNRLDSLIAQLQ